MEKVKKTNEKAKRSEKNEDVEEGREKDVKESGGLKKNLLFDLYHTEYWPEIVKYADINSRNCFEILGQVDPSVEATKMARTQGIRLGGYSFIQMVESIVRNAEKKSEDI